MMSYFVIYRSYLKKKNRKILAIIYMQYFIYSLFFICMLRWYIVDDVIIMFIGLACVHVYTGAITYVRLTILGKWTVRVSD